MAHSDVTKAKISAGVKRACKAGKVIGRPFTRGNKLWKVAIRARTEPRKKPVFSEDGMRRLRAATKLANGTPERREMSRKAALDRLAWEKREADKLVADGYEVLVPSWTCDRIAIKDGRVYFVEFKQHGQPLRQHQQRVFDVAPDSYMIVYSDYRETPP